LHWRRHENNLDKWLSLSDLLPLPMPLLLLPCVAVAGWFGVFGCF